MGLAPYGEPKYAGVIREKLVHVCADGSIRLNMEYFDFADRLTMTGAGFERLFGGPRASARVEAHAARDGSRALDPGRDRGDRPEDGPPREEDDRREVSLPGRRRRAELRREREAPRGAGSSTTSGSSPRRATRAEPSAPRSRCGTGTSECRARARRRGGRGGWEERKRETKKSLRMKRGPEAAKRFERGLWRRLSTCRRTKTACRARSSAPLTHQKKLRPG